MEKVICDICGTSYPESEECCPVCGSFQDLEFNFDLETEEDDFLKDSPIVAVKEQKLDEALEEFLNEPDEEEEAEEDDEDAEEEEEPRRGKAGVVVFLVILIMLLLAACGFLFVRYILPNMDMGEPAASESLLQTEEPVETTTEPGIPCEQLILTSGATLDMTREGEYKLIHVMAKPEDTTDKITYVSSDESIVTVNEEGRVTGVAEGEATITVICGEQKVECLVRVQYVPETEPTTEPVSEKTEAPEETTEAEQTEPAEETMEATTEATEAQLKDVTLKLGRTDVSMGVGYQFTIPLECDLEYSEIEWSTGNPGIATIKDGVITTLSKGTTQMFAKYGDQVVTGWIRVK